MNQISQFYYAITNTLHIYSSTAKFLHVLQTVERVSHYYRSVQHSYTRRQLTDTNDLSSESPDFIHQAKSIILNFIVALSGYTSYYVSTTVILTLSIYYKPKNTEWPHKYRMRKINPDIHFLCEMNETVKLYWTVFSLSDAEWHYFTNKNNMSSYNFLTSVQLYKDIGL